MGRVSASRARRWLVRLSAGTLLAYGNPQVASAEPVKPVPMETVEVIGQRISETERQAPTAFATVIEPSEHTEQMEDAADALAESVGTQVRRFGGLGAFSLISIRGSNPNQVRVYLDGIPLSRASNDTVDLSSLPLDGLERIEVYRGIVPVAFGVRGTAGVINLVTQPPSPTPSTQIAAAYGSFTTRKVVVSHSQEVRGVGLLANATYLGSQGDFTFFDDNGTDVNTSDDDPDATRKNNAFNSLDAILKGRYSFAGDWTFDLTNETFYKDQGIPGVDNNQSRDASLNRLRTLTYLRGGNATLFDGNVDAAAAAFVAFERDEFADPKGELFNVELSTLTRTTSVGASVSGTYYPFPSQALSWFTELSGERFLLENQLQDRTLPDQNRLDVAVALQDRASFLDDRIVIVPSIGYEHLEDRVSSSFAVTDEPDGPKVTKTNDFFNPAVGVEVRPWSWLILKGNIGRYQRAPNFSELFGNQGILLGNPDLKPEKVLNRDIGCAIAWTPPRWVDQLRLEYAYFNNDSDDLITPVEVSADRFSFANIGAARVRGHELGVHARGFDHAGIDLNYTHQDAKNRSDIPQQWGKQIPFLPADELYLRLSAFNAVGEVYYELNYIARNFTDAVEFDEVPSRDLHALGFQVQYWAPLSIYFEARNITDNQISDLADFPLPGLSFLGGIKVRL